MTTYTVTEILGQNEWAPADEPSKRTIYWSFRADGVDKVCEIGRKPGNDLQVGESFEATSREDRGKLKLKRVQSQNFNGKGQDKPWPRQPTPPEDAARMLRCHSQSVAVQAVEVAVGLGVEERPKDMEAFLKLVRRTSDYMDRDVETVVANAQLSLDDAQRRSEEGF